MATMKTWTEYTKEIMEELQMVAGKTFDKEQTKKRRSESACWGALLVAAAIFLYVKVQSITFIVLPIVLIAVGALLIYRAVFFYKFTAAMTVRYMKKNNMQVHRNDFIFEEDEIVMINGEEELRYEYLNCSQIVEADHCIFFIINNKGGLMMDKKNLEGGTLQEFRVMLEEKCARKLVWVGKGNQPA